MPSMSSPDARTSDQPAKFDRWAVLLDSRFSVLGYRVGWDSILGLIPGVGDAITIVPAALMIHAGQKSGVRKPALGRMALNTGLDVAVGTVPFIGDLFDVVFKSHKKNLHILRTEIEHHRSKPAAQT